MPPGLRDPRTPIHILTGWLGAGKTTLLNKILSSPQQLRWIVLVNEFGDIGIDHKLVVHAEEDLIELQNGCVCCTVRGDLVKALIELKEPKGWLKKRPTFDRVIIETTGVAQPGPLLRTLLVESQVAENFKLAGLVCMVDALNADSSLAESVALDQLASADVVVLNKIDLVDKTHTAKLKKQLASINPEAPCFSSTYGNIDVLEILRERRREMHTPQSTTDNHLGDIQALSLKHTTALDEMKVQLWLAGCAQSLGGELIRWKGFLHLHGRSERCVLQGVYDVYSVEAGEPWEDKDRFSELVFIGRGLDEATLRKGLKACEAAG